MNTFVFLILILAVHETVASCEENRQLEYNCAQYCFKIVKPLLDSRKELQSQVDRNDLQQQLDSLAKLENIERVLVKLESTFQLGKLEKKLQESMDKLEHQGKVIEEIRNTQKQQSDFLIKLENIERVLVKLDTPVKNIEDLIQVKFGTLEKRQQETEVTLKDQGNVTKDSLTKLDNIERVLQNSNSVAKLENIERQLQEKFVILEKKIEQRMDDLSKTIQKQKTTIDPSFQRIGSKYYYIEKTEKVNWFTAAHRCRALGGNLASFQNKDEYDTVLSHLSRENTYWIGLNDLGTKDEYFSIGTGSKAAYLNWNKGEPNHATYLENCVQLWFGMNHIQFLMDDKHCFAEMCFICEA